MSAVPLFALQHAHACQVDSCREDASLIPWHIDVSQTTSALSLNLWLCHIHGPEVLHLELAGMDVDELVDAMSEDEREALHQRLEDELYPEEDEEESPCAEEETDDESAKKWRAVGREFGYPECCIEAFVQRRLSEKNDPRRAEVMDSYEALNAELRALNASHRAPGSLEWTGDLSENPLNGRTDLGHGWVPCPQHWANPPVGYGRREYES